MKKIVLLISLIGFLGCNNLGTFDQFGKNSITGTYYNLNGYDVNGYDVNGYDKNGVNRIGFNKEGINIYTGTNFDLNGYDKYGYNKMGYNRNGYNREGYDKDGYNYSGYDKNGYNRNGYDLNGYDKEGYSVLTGYNKEGYDRKGIHKDIKIFHILAWGDLDNENGDSKRMFYDVSSKPTYYFSLFSNNEEPYRVKLARNIINKYGDLRFYKRDLVEKNFEKIYNDDNYKNYINIKTLMNRDLNIYKEIQNIYKTRKQTETFEDFIKRKINILENYKKTLDKVMVFKMNGKELNLEYDPYNEVLKTNKEHIFKTTNYVNKGSYIGSNAFGFNQRVEVINIYNKIVNVVSETSDNFIKNRIYRTPIINFYISKNDFQKNNYNMNNFVVEFIVITNSHLYFKGENKPTLDNPIESRTYENVINYELLGVKIRYNNKVIYKNSYI